MDQLASHYQSLLFVYRHATVMPKIALIAVLYLVATGNRYPGFQMLSAVMAIQLFVAGCFSTGAGLGPGIVAATAFGCCLILLPLLTKPEVEWRVLPEEDSAWYWPALLAIVVSILFPFIGDRPSFWNTVIYAPMALIPHGTIALGLLLAAQSHHPRLTAAGWAMSLAVIPLVACDLMAGFLLGPIFLIGCAVAFGTTRLIPRIMVQRRQAGGLVEREKSNGSGKREPSQPPTRGRKWDL